VHLEKGAVTRLLDAWSSGDPEALPRLMPLVMQDLKRIARRLLRQEPDNRTLDPTDLVSELYLRLVGKRSVQWKNSRQFFGEMARMIRHILIDHARSRHRQKRGQGGRPTQLDEVFSLAEATPPQIEALNAALAKLGESNERQSLVVHLRYFVGLSEEEIAGVLGVSPRTVKRDWSTAKLWLYDQLSCS
jgi:RNA polymerase sigma factor (TIGR02999 family)